MRRVAILGATGSIGRAALEVLSRFPDELQLVGFSARRDLQDLGELLRIWHPQALALPRGRAERTLQDMPFRPQDFYTGSEALVQLATREDVDLVLVAVVGFAGLRPTLAALECGKTVALATKEVLVAAGDLIQAATAKGGGRLVPVDSEHSAIYQCLEGRDRASLARIFLTASGGPFLKRAVEELTEVTVAEALAHPTWRMGPKITVDSATLVNKGLEVIEAHHLFGLPGEQIKVLLHPQSIVHSLVELKDGVVFAQLSLPDMRLPIQYALLQPQRLPSCVQLLDLIRVGHLDFATVDVSRFPALPLAYAALEAGGSTPAALSAADEVAVSLFLEGKLPFLGIVPLIDSVLQETELPSGGSLEAITEADRLARLTALRLAGQAS